MRIKIFTIFLLICFVSAQQNDLTVTVNDGVVQGYVNALGTHKVWNLPYAQPPVGDNRWRSPQPVIPWGNSTTYNASVMPPMCPQTGSFSTFFPNSEDCLYLFVWVPLNHSASDTPLPVQIWMHGGAYTSGAGQMYTGDIAPANDFIYVSVSYRLGVLGFFSHPTLQNTEEHKDGAGFYGIQDQRLAFQWVRDNIKFFGGDNSKVTISGESAGATSVCIHLVAPRSVDLFHKGIMQSGACELQTLESETLNSVALASKVGCNGTDAAALECLMNADFSSLLDYLPAPQPTVNPNELADQPFIILSNGGGLRIPLLIGSNTDEGTLATCPDPKLNNITNIEYFLLVNSTYPELVDLIMQTYPPESFKTPSDALANILSDGLIKCPSKHLADIFSLFPDSPTYFYNFNHLPSYFSSDEVVKQLFGEEMTVECLGVTHAYEIAIQFNLFDQIVSSLGLQLSPEELQLRETMRQAWSSFIVSGIPSLPNDSTVAPYLEIDLSSSAEAGYRQNYCALWNANIPINPTTTGDSTTTTGDSTTGDSTTGDSTTTTTTTTGDSTTGDSTTTATTEATSTSSSVSLFSAYLIYAVLVVFAL